MSRSRKDNTMLGAMGVLVVFAAYNFLIKPQNAELSAIRDERTAVEQSVADADLALRRPPDVADLPVGIDAGALAAAIPADPAIATLLRQLQQIASETGTLQGSISPTAVAPNPAGPGGSLQVAITASGSHEATLAYLQRLRDLERLVVIEQIAINVQPDATEQLQIAARVFTQQPPSDSLVSP